MATDVFIFGYQSMLAEGSLATSIGAGKAAADYVPARLRGYVRGWQAVRNFSSNPRKRYVHTGDWRPAGRVAFATLTPADSAWVNGLCHRVSTDRLHELDFREQGYARVDVSGLISPYPGHALAADLPCYVYLEREPDPSPAAVSRSYYEMGRHGARAIDRKVPGFAADYEATTQPPAVIADDLAFVFISADGCHLWLLDEADSSLVLLLRFAHAQFAPTSRSLPEATRPVSGGLEWLDLRGPRMHLGSHARIPARLAVELTGPPGPELAASAFWLARLTAIESAALQPQQLQILATDPDPWVRRAAHLYLGDPP